MKLITKYDTDIHIGNGQGLIFRYYSATPFFLNFKEWTFVENRPFDNEDEARPPLYQMKDIGTENYKIYDYGKIRPATKEECAGLEVCATWAHIHLVKRLMCDEVWKKYFPGFYED